MFVRFGPLFAKSNCDFLKNHVINIFVPKLL
jgi:hypothetical protein